MGELSPPLVTDGGRMPDTDEARGTAELTVETVFDLLSNDRRRWVVRELDGREEAVEFRELYETLASEEVAARGEDGVGGRTGNESPAVSYQDRKRVYVSLRQTHLPRLDAAGVVAFDEDASTVTPREPIGTLESVLERADRAVRTD